jgi:hypothetical protein
MRYLLLAALLVVGLATAASAQSEAIGVSGFTVTHGELSGSGMLGGVHGTIVSTVSSGDCTSSCSGTWVMLVNSTPFSGGTFTCTNSDCMYMGNVMTRNSSGFAISTTTTGVATDVDASIYQHNLYVNDVRSWANTHANIISSMNMTSEQFINGASNDNKKGQ